MNSTQKALVVLEIEKNGRKYSLSMDMGAPLGEIYDALFAMLQDVSDMSKAAVEKAKPMDSDQQEA